MYGHMHSFTYTYMYIFCITSYVYISVHICVYVYTHMNICVYIYIHICMYVCTYMFFLPVASNPCRGALPRSRGLRAWSPTRPEPFLAAVRFGARQAPGLRPTAGASFLGSPLWHVYIYIYGMHGIYGTWYTVYSVWYMVDAWRPRGLN